MRTLLISIVILMAVVAATHVFAMEPLTGPPAVSAVL
jgi:hypothetical protein